MLEPKDIQKLRGLTSLESLVDYLRDELDWPIEAEDTEKITFSYKISDLGIDQRYNVKIKDIHQIRPLATDQPWGVFYLEFESKELPVLVLRRILRSLVPSSRYSNPDKPIWKKSDLLFISSQGVSNNRSISFAHFRQDASGKDELRTFSWDVRETHLYYIKNLNLKALRWPEDDTDVQSWREEWSKAFTVRHREVPQTAEMLANEMARIGRDIREAVTEVYNLEHVGGPLHQLHLSLKMDLINDLSEADFADMYAQTVTYGLFAARATRTGGFQQEDAPAMIAHTNPFLRELLQQMLDQHTLDLDELGVSELTQLLNKVNMDAILQSFGVQKRGEDPVIHFYETFMRAYDPEQKMKRGEFYTPDPVVSFIVRSVDHLLRTEFGCKDGLATVNSDPNAFQPVVLDPATGTGTFLKYVIEVIWDTFYNKHKNISAAVRKIKWNRFVRENVLPRLYAFELKMSPYTIAHMKVGLALQQKGFEFEEGERLQIYLSNALQPAHEVSQIDTPALAHEVQKANIVKNNMPITVVVGNPPYSNFGMMNKGDWILQLLEDYKKDLNEKKVNLNDDYIKFIRFAQWILDKSDQGLVALITNNSFIDGITHRVMRKSLLSTFDEIFILNLHGSLNRKNEIPDGLVDENVFDIQQGVAISFFIRKSKHVKESKVFYADLYGKREQKYDKLLLHNISSIQWNEIENLYQNSCLGAFYFFTPMGFDRIDEYCEAWSVKDIFNLMQNGIKTDRDELFIDIRKSILEERMQRFFSSEGLLAPFKDQYRVENSSSYDLLLKRSKTSYDPSCIHRILYRPFDYQWIYYQPGLTSRPAWEIMRHMINLENLSLITTRQTKFEFSVLCTRNISEKACANSVDINTTIPLYLQSTTQSNINQDYLFVNDIDYTVNLKSEFLKYFAHKLDLSYTTNQSGNLITNFGPNDIFNYLYGILNSPTYKQNYSEFLRIDFPRIPLTSNIDLFRTICGHGKQLVGLHLLESSDVNESISNFTGNGERIVVSGYPKYSHGTVWINPFQGFDGVPEEVWNFCIGGYQVCHKWLKDRRGRQLSAEDIEHYQKVVVALNETIRIMGEIDAVIEEHGGWPIR